jgi:hypothetical protein
MNHSSAASVKKAPGNSGGRTAGSLHPVDGARGNDWPPAHALTGRGACGRQERGPRPDWARVAGVALAILINGFAVLHVSLPPSVRSQAPVPLEWAQVPRNALIVESVEAVVIDPPEARDPPTLVSPIPRRPASQPLSRVAARMPQSTPESAPVAPPHVRWSLSELTTIDEVTPAPGARRDPKAASAALYRRPAITYEPTRFNDAWQSQSLAERARQSTFSYARLCSLNDEMRQARGCSRDERNAAASAMRGERVDIALRPDAAVD